MILARARVLGDTGGKWSGRLVQMTRPLRGPRDGLAAAPPAAYSRPVASDPRIRLLLITVAAIFVIAELLGWLPPITADTVQPNR